MQKIRTNVKLLYAKCSQNNFAGIKTKLSVKFTFKESLKYQSKIAFCK